MERIKLHDKFFRICIPHEKIMEAVSDVAARLNRDLRNVDTPIFLSVLSGSFMFTADLMKKVELPCDIAFIKLASYSGTESTGEVKQIMGLNRDIKGRTVVIVEDIVDTGGTIVELDKLLRRQGAADIRVCTLLFKPGSYSKHVKIDYAAMEIPNDFIVGYGLDYDQLGRQYKDIYVLDSQQ